MIFDKINPVKFQVIDNLEDSALGAGWKRLYLENDLFLHSSLDWVRLWWKHFGGSNRKLHVLVGESNGVIQAIAPFMIESSHFLRQLKFIGSGLTDYHEILFDPEAGIDQVESLIRIILDSREYDIVNLEQISNRSPIYSILVGSDGWQSRKMSNCLRIKLDFPAWDDYEKQLKKKFRSNCRSKLRGLEREGRVEFQCHHSSDITPELTRAIFSLVEENYKQTGRFDKLNMGSMQAFISELIQVIPETTIFTLKLEDVLLAYSLNFFQNQTFYHWNSGFNREFGRYAPGVLLRYHLIRFLIETGAKEIDFMRGNYDYKQRFLVDDKGESINHQFLQKTSRFKGAFGLKYYIEWKWTAKKMIGKVLNAPQVRQWLLRRKHRS